MEIHRPNITKHNSADKSQGVDSRKFIPKRYHDVASGMEKQFAKYLVEQMTNGTNITDKNSPAGDYYQDILVDEYTKKLSDQGSGLGIKDIILDDIYPKKFRNPSNYKAYQQAMNEKSARFNRQSNIEMIGPPQEKEVQMKKNSSIQMGVKK